MSIKAIPFALAGLAASALMVGAGYYAGNQASSSAAVQASAPSAGLPQQIEQIIATISSKIRRPAEMQVALEQRQQNAGRAAARDHRRVSRRHLQFKV